MAPDMQALHATYTAAPSGLWILRFGTNFIGLVALDASAPGETVRVRHLFVDEKYRAAGAQDDLLVFALGRAFAEARVGAVRISWDPLRPYVGEAAKRAGFRTLTEGNALGSISDVCSRLHCRGSGRADRAPTLAEARARAHPAGLRETGEAARHFIEPCWLISCANAYTLLAPTVGGCNPISWLSRTIGAEHRADRYRGKRPFSFLVRNIRRVSFCFLPRLRHDHAEHTRCADHAEYLIVASSWLVCRAIQYHRRPWAHRCLLWTGILILSGSPNCGIALQ
jgi:hypothetical protein